ncbi:MAG: hypothetical protein Q9186_000595 [Xanthomendoza sp. 1 TL-2023]
MVAFVEMDNHETAATAICQLNGYNVNGRPLKGLVELPASTTNSHPILPNNAFYHSSRLLVYAVETRFQSDRGSAVVKMDNHEAAAMAMFAKLNGYNVNDRPLSLQRQNLIPRLALFKERKLAGKPIKDYLPSYTSADDNHNAASQRADKLIQDYFLDDTGSDDDYTGSDNDYNAASQRVEQSIKDYSPDYTGSDDDHTGSDDD